MIRFAPKRIDNLAPTVTPQQCVDFVLSHAFERASVVAEEKLLQQAYQYSIGIEGLTIEDIESCLHHDPRLIRIDERGKVMATIMEVAISPFPEFVHSKDDKYWLNGNLPRVLTITEFESLLKLDVKKIITKNLFAINQQ